MTRGYTLVAIALVAAAFLGTAAMYAVLPERIPTHFDFRGRVDGYGPRGVLFLVPAVMVWVLGLLSALPWMSPSQFKIDPFRATYSYMVVLVVGFLGYLHATILVATARGGIDFWRVMVAGLCLLLAAMANVMGKVRRNFFVGVRVPWTLASERVWNETHRVAAWAGVASGLLGFAIAAAGYPFVALAMLASAIVVPIVFSFVLYKRLEGRGEV